MASKISDYSSFVAKFLNGIGSYIGYTIIEVLDMDKENYLARCLTKKGNVFFILTDLDYDKDTHVNKTEVIKTRDQDISIIRSCLSSRGYDVDGIVFSQKVNKLTYVHRNSESEASLKFNTYEDNIFYPGLYPLYNMDNLQKMGSLDICDIVSEELNHNIMLGSLKEIKNYITNFDTISRDLSHYVNLISICKDSLEDDIITLTNFYEEYETNTEMYEDFEKNKNLTKSNIEQKTIQLKELTANVYKVKTLLNPLKSIQSMISETNNRIQLISQESGSVYK